MNKKNLSVVMAGAMLATSVAPVLADTTTDEKVYEVSKGNAGLLINELDKFFADAPKFSDVKENGSLAGEPVYGYVYRKASDSKWDIKKENGITDTSKIKELLKDGNEYQIKVIDRGYIKEGDKILATQFTDPVHDGSQKHASTNITNQAKAIASQNAIDTAAGKTGKTYANSSAGNAQDLEYLVALGIVKGNTKAKVENNSLTFELASGIAITNSVGSDMLDYKYLRDNKGNVIEINGDKNSDGNIDLNENDKKIDAKSIVDILDYAEVKAYKRGRVDIESKELYNVKLVNGDVKETYKSDDLYDGFMLTTTGHDILNEVNQTEKETEKQIVFSGIKSEFDKEADKMVYSFNFVTEVNKVKKYITVTGDNKARVETLRTWLNDGKATVDILSGDNRYATAVSIAETFIEGAYNNTNNKDIVLVNGNALVDGLAAAPYAKSLNSKNGAPILLTKDSSLPKETKDFLRKLVGSNEVANPGTVHIIGGEAVVSENVVSELKDMGFKVKRISGDNREETSLAVAQKLNSDTKAYVVGANGEADAMSIAPVAASEGNPIIVSKSTKGISTVGVNALSDYNNVEIIGGENAVSKSDEEKIKEVVDNEKNVTRTAGNTRKETNALIIKEHYKTGFDKVLVTSDSKLVDALPVSMFAVNSKTIAPIVLAEKSLSDSQLNQIVLGANKPGTTVYQIGGSVERSVLETIVTKLGLNK